MTAILMAEVDDKVTLAEGEVADEEESRFGIDAANKSGDGVMTAVGSKSETASRSFEFGIIRADDVEDLVSDDVDPVLIC